MYRDTAEERREGAATSDLLYIQGFGAINIILSRKKRRGGTINYF